jgi:hypothetical protein
LEGKELARNQFQSTVRETLDKMLTDPDINNSIGVAKFSKKKKGVFCKFYIRKGNLYSVFSTEISPDYITRLYQSGDISEHNLEIIKKRFGNNLRHLEIPEFLIDRHMVSEEAMENVKQDFFLDIFDNIIEWDEVNGDWIANETTDTLKIAPVSLERILDLINNRRSFLVDVAQTFNVSLEDLNKIKFIQKRESGFDNETPLIFHQLISMADGQSLVEDVSINFGLTHFRTIQALYNIWSNDIVTLYMNNQEIVSNVINEEPEEIQESDIVDEIDSFEEEFTEEENDVQPIAEDVNIDDKSSENIDIHISVTENTPIIEKNSETVKTSLDFADSTSTGSQQTSSNKGIMSLILPNLGNEDGKLVGRTGGEGVTVRREPIIIKDARKIANEEEDNKKKLSYLKQERENLLNILANDLDFVEEGNEEDNSPEAHNEIAEINEEIESIENEIAQEDIGNELDDFSLEEEEEEEEEEEDNATDVSIDITNPEDAFNDYSESTEEIAEIESYNSENDDDSTVENIADDSDELDETIEPLIELPDEKIERAQPMSDQLPDLSSMIDTIYKQLNSQKEYIEETEQSIADDARVIEALHIQLEQKKDNLTKLKEEYSASIAKLQFFSN